jgi:ketosteroid isomerase-like protein
VNLADLEKRLLALEDQEEIKRLHQNYVSYMDTLQFDRIIELFTEDAIAEIRSSGVHTGAAQIAELYSRLSNRRNNIKDGHMVIQPDICVKGDKATGSWIVYILFSKPTVQWVQGRNECEYVKENGKWKFSKLKFIRTNASDPGLFP